MKAYCRNCTDRQLENVLCDEADRYHRHGGEGDTADTALKLYHAAREECARRGIDPDALLAERGVADPDD